jgi:hypothetical protein
VRSMRWQAGWADLGTPPGLRCGLKPERRKK